MTIEPICYVCGKEEPCIDGLCSECHMREFWNPGAAFAATFGSLSTRDYELRDSDAPHGMDYDDGVDDV